MSREEGSVVVMAIFLKLGLDGDSLSLIFVFEYLSLINLMSAFKQIKDRLKEMDEEDSEV